MLALLLSITMTVYLLTLGSACPLHCECVMYSSAQQALRNADAAFLGRIIASRDTVLTEGEGPGGLYLVFTFLVERRWKGPDGEQIDVVTPFHSTACGASFARSEPYLVFARRYRQQLWVTTSCDFNRPQSQARGHIRALGRPAFSRSEH
jgi:hypothetical protein